MKKLKAAIQYECITSLKYICVYYLALGAVLAVYFTISHLLEFKFWNICLEMNTMILVGIIGILHLQEDFRMLLQNGFTRTCIFLAAIVHFAFIAGMLSMVDTAGGQPVSCCAGSCRALTIPYSEVCTDITTRSCPGGSGCSWCIC